MNLKEYQKLAYKYAKYPAEVKGVYNALQIANELSEVAGKLIKSLRDGMNNQLKKDIADEIGDVLWHMAGLCSDCDKKIFVPFYVEEYPFKINDISEIVNKISETSHNIICCVNKQIKDNRGQDYIYYDNALDIWSILNFLISQLGFNLNDILQNNLDKLESRFQRGVIGGSGDKR